MLACAYLGFHKSRIPYDVAVLAEELDRLSDLAWRRRDPRPALWTAITPEQPLLPHKADKRYHETRDESSDKPIRAVVPEGVNGRQKSKREGNAEHHEVLEVSFPKRRIFFTHRHI